MSSKTKIVVLRMKEIIYTAIFIGLGLLLIALLLIMFPSWKEDTECFCPCCGWYPLSARHVQFYPDTWQPGSQCRSHG